MKRIFSESKKKYTSGFTLVEMLVVIIIITILSSLFVVNYKNIQNQLALERAAFGLANDIRRAQERAMSAGAEPECTNPNFKYKYGVYIESGTNQYRLFADCNDNGKYQPADVDYIVNLVDFKEVEIPPDPINSFKKISIVFAPPDPVVSFSKDPLPDPEEVSIIIRVNNDNTKIKTVTVNKAGLVDIQ
jgi:prepilin-type N-terminal cleavage/methylation domain-containing protein